jgi:hypothetical protein
MTTQVSPHDHKIGHAFAVAAPELAKAMHALSDGAEIPDRENPQAVRNKFSAEISALLTVRAAATEPAETVMEKSLLVI